jgi:putative endonuclease
VTNYQLGKSAEDHSAAYLRGQGFQILDRNWRTPRCEIDIVAKKNGEIFFVEVKSRKSMLQGRGYEYVTVKKLKQMAYAAESWVAVHSWSGPYQISVISIDGDKITLITEVDF